MARILQVFRPRTGGTYGHVRVLAAELAARGHEVAVCGPAGESGGDDFGVPLLPVPIPRDPAPGPTAASVRAVGGAYRRFRPDLIHVHGAQAGVVGRLARAAAPAIPLVHTPHRYAFVDGSGPSASNLAYRALERALMPLATRVLCVCEAEREVAIGLGAGARTRVVHNGIEPRPAGPLDPRFGGLAEDGPLIVAVSELFRRKGVPTLIEAMPAILTANPGANLVVAGEGPERAEAEEARDRLGLAGRVHLAGHVPDPSGLSAAADVFVNPALAEAFPYGVLEAMAAGAPCVVTDAGGCAEAIADGESGLVVPVGDAEALAAAVNGLLADRDTAARMADAAAARVRERFTRERMIAGTEAVYAELVGA
ncbi:MAG: glycosyltransferase family 4 protein [Solirubrobacterales bacterium]